MASTSAFSKKLLPDMNTIYKSQLHNTTIVSSNLNNTTIIEEEKEEKKRQYTINFSDEKIENDQIFQVEVMIPLSYTISQSHTLIVGVMNRLLKPYHCKLNPGAEFALYQSKKNGKPKLDLPSFITFWLFIKILIGLAEDTMISETGVTNFSLGFREKKEHDIVYTKKKNNHSLEVANKIYQNCLKREIKVKKTASRDETKGKTGKRSFFMFCSCNW